VQQPQVMVGEVPKAVPEGFDLPSEQVHGLDGRIGAAAGRVEGEDLDLPRAAGAGQARQLGDLDAIRPAVQAVEGGAGRCGAGRGVDGPQQLFACRAAATSPVGSLAVWPPRNRAVLTG
jgi:hypothetical protein